MVSYNINSLPDNLLRPVSLVLPNLGPALKRWSEVNGTTSIPNNVIPYLLKYKPEKKKKKNPEEEEPREAEGAHGIEPMEADEAHNSEPMEAEEAHNSEPMEAEGAHNIETMETEGVHINGVVGTNMEPDTQLESDVEMLSNEADKKRMFVPGDLVWAQSESYPYYPAMVSYHPDEWRFTKLDKAGKKIVRIVRWYHVQYFGERAQRGWVTESSIFLYEGEWKFHVVKNERFRMVNNASQRKKYDSCFHLSKGEKHRWRIAVQEAELAFTFKDVETRFAKFVFKYESKPVKHKKVKKVSKKNGAASKNGSSKRKRKHKDAQKSSKRARIASDIYEDVCRICEQGNIDIKCSGTCLRSFHKDCLGLKEFCILSENFKCAACETGMPCCFVCYCADSDVIKCDLCNYYFHDKCMEKYECYKKKKNICTRHSCLTCFRAKYRKAKGGSLTHCLKCPTTFHASPKCIPVGSVKLTPSLVICPDHFLGKKKVSPQPRVNISYCVKCGTGGDLVCCETCPNAVHTTCIETEITDDDFFCEPCRKRQYLYVGMIVWAKSGTFRWWPAILVNPTHAPENIQKLQHFDGELLVQFFFTDEYFWTHRGRVIPYADYHRKKDKKREENKNENSINSKFNASLEEAAKAYEDYLEEIHTRECDRKKPYKFIVANRAVPPASIASNDLKASYVCNCDPKAPDPCGPDSQCLNRAMLVECNPKLCAAKDNCRNQRFTKRQYPKMTVFETENRGYGLQASEFIPTGTFVIEYVGEVITHDEYRRRFQHMVRNNIENYYFLYLDSQRMIDAGPKGNLSRFINHSCDPNCQMEKWSAEGDLRVGIFAIKDIQPGEELTFNYQSDSVLFHLKCLCGAPNCQGFVGRNGKSSSKVNEKNNVKKKGKTLVKNKGENNFKN